MFKYAVLALALLATVFTSGCDTFIPAFEDAYNGRPPGTTPYCCGVPSGAATSGLPTMSTYMGGGLTMYSGNGANWSVQQSGNTTFYHW